jgi:hypothetical protein
MLIRLALVLLLGLTFTACDSADPDPATPAGNRFAVRLVNTGSERLDVTHAVRWCYDGAACPAPTTAALGSGGAGALVNANQSMVLWVSQADQTVTGAGVRVEVEAGSGRVEVLRGTLTTQWPDDFQGTPVHSAPLVAGEAASFSFTP